jgi:aminoglycoside 6'-N-acetyltransferase I
MVTIRPAEGADSEAWERMRRALWPHGAEDHAPEIAAYFRLRPEDEACLVAEAPEGELVGFVEVRLRPWAEGCRTSPVGYLEGVYVRSRVRREGVGRRLVAAAERWARARECVEMASDHPVGDDAGGAFHAALGYAEADRIVCLRKDLGDPGGTG